jgi:hypothetical protein
VNWTELQRGDVLVDDNRITRDDVELVLLILTPPTPESLLIEYLSLVSGVYHSEEMLSSGGEVERDGWYVERLP